MCLHKEDLRITADNDQVDLERSMFIQNHEMWEKVYGQEQMIEGPGTVIKMPTTEEEFEEMVREWEEDGYVPGVG